MEAPAVLRLFRCHPLSLAFDTILREELLPEMRDLPGVGDVFVGRRGPGELGERVVASVWSAMEGMLDAMGGDLEASRFHPERLAATTARSLTAYPLSVVLATDAQRAPKVMRIAQGQVAPGELSVYVAEARAGAEEDRAGEGGPIGFYVARTGVDGFLTLSLWADWDAIARATGADLDHPIQTRRPDRIVSFQVTHFEVLPDSARR